MERRKTNKIPSTILCSDMHLREDTPVCFVGDYQKEQWKCVDFISELQKKYGCPVLHAGDLFDKWKSSPWLLSMAINHLPKQFFSCVGQHDLPQHALDLIDKSGIYTLQQAGIVKMKDECYKNFEFYFCHFGEDPSKIKMNTYTDEKINILIWHHLTYQTKPFPGAEGGMAEGLLRKYDKFDLICTGDNHQAFTTEYKGRRLVNPGSMMRMDADQIDFKPRVYLWYAEDNSVVPVYLPIEEGAISREHIEHKEERDSRIDAFVSKLDGDWVAGMSFEENLEEFERQNKVDSEVMEIVYKSID